MRFLRVLLHIYLRSVLLAALLNWWDKYIIFHSYLFTYCISSTVQLKRTNYLSFSTQKKCWEVFKIYRILKILQYLWDVLMIYFLLCELPLYLYAMTIKIAIEKYKRTRAGIRGDGSKNYFNFERLYSLVKSLCFDVNCCLSDELPCYFVNHGRPFGVYYPLRRKITRRCTKTAVSAGVRERRERSGEGKKKRRKGWGDFSPGRYCTMKPSYWKFADSIRLVVVNIIYPSSS